MRLRREERGDTIILWHRLVPFLARVEAILALDLFLDSIALGIHLGWRGRTQSWLGTGGVTQGAVGALRVGQLLLALILELGGILQALLVVLRDGAPISETDLTGLTGQCKAVVFALLWSINSQQCCLLWRTGRLLCAPTNTLSVMSTVDSRKQSTVKCIKKQSTQSWK